MKKQYLLILFTLVWVKFSFAQLSKEDIQPLENQITRLNENFEKLTDKNIQFGISLGYRLLTEKSAKEYQNPSISPLDSTLNLAKIENGSFVLSTSIIFNPRLPTERLSKNLSTQIALHVAEKYDDPAETRPVSISDKILLNTLMPSESFESFASSKINTTIEQFIKAPTDENTMTPVVVFNFLSDLKREIHEEADLFEKKRLKKLKRRVRWLTFKKFLIDYLIDRISVNANLNLIEFSTAQKELSFNKSIEGGLGISYMVNPNLYFGVNWENFFTRQLQDYLKAQEGKMLRIDGSYVTSIEDLNLENDDLYIDRNLNGISLKLIASF